MSDIKPLVSILMAVYEPNLDWFREQLLSLNSQTYPQIHLYIIDDCSPTVSFKDINNIVTECVNKFQFTILRNGSNMGSNRTFEALTKLAEGQYFAYCDQDDIWLPNKLSVLYNAIVTSGALLVCSDMYVIDANGKVKANTITNIRRHHIFHSGTNLLPRFLVSNFVTGCTMLINASIAKESIPFCPYMVHDHYLAFYSSIKGPVLSLKDPLIYYRIHDKNQTLVMNGVTDKKSYYEKRIVVSIKKFQWLKDNINCNEINNCSYISRALSWGLARDDWFQKRDFASFYNLWKFRNIKLSETLFELVSLVLPNCIFKFLIWLYKRNVF
ncbi:glycosyltransferase [Succinimonas sp.]|uniref:glycosyltransferase n=1 Tax=Succinimonas sp. TaxID=1936151 RepID=UPI00386AE696